MRFIKNKLLKCYWCNEKDREDKIEVVHGKQKRRYHAYKCYDLYLEDKAFKEQESKELDQLYETIKKVCGISVIPPSFMGLIQRLRNGDPIIGMKKGDKKHFKQGFKYPVIQKAYEQKADLIKWKKDSWDGSIGRFLTFVLFYYIMDVIENVNEEWERQEQRKKRLEYTKQDITFEADEQITYTKQNDELDISKFL